MEINYFTLNAFAKTKDGGNPAGVVLNSDFLSDEDMLKISQEIGFSETAFVQKSNLADFKVRFFTPTEEVDLCGHATIATFFLMAKKNILIKGNYRQETKAGILNFEVQNNGIIFMNQNPPQFFEKIDKKEISQSLNISEEIISDDLPIQIVSTGLRDIFIPIKSLKELDEIKPDFEKITKISRKYNVIGYHLFSLETKFNSTAHCRNFAPLYDIPEEAGTGTSSGALSCYLFKYGKITKSNLNSLVFEQGYSMNRPSEIFVKLKLIGNDISEVKVGGIASDIKEKNLFL